MPKADIEALKAANPILQVCQALGVEVIHGRIRCPRPELHAHGDRTPSVSIRADRGTFKCWVCPDVKGDVIDLVRLVRECSFPEALEFLGGGQAGPGGTQVRQSKLGAVHEEAPAPAFEDESKPQTELFGIEPSPGGVHHGTKVGPQYGKAETDALRRKVLAAFLEACAPVSGKVARYLQKRRIFRRTWDSQGLKMVDDYAGISNRLAAAFGETTLELAGLFNTAGHLRYYRHALIFPYFDLDGSPAYLQARAIDAEVKPKELSLAGPITLPYNRPLLDGNPGQVFLCEGVIDTLTLIEQGFPSVGVPGAGSFKPEWAPLFHGKTVHVAFDSDAPGEAGAARAIALLQEAGVEARRLSPPAGMDLNDWFRKGGPH